MRISDALSEICVFPVRFDKMAAVPMTLPVDVDMGPQVDDDPDDPDIADIR